MARMAVYVRQQWGELFDGQKKGIERRHLVRQLYCDGWSKTEIAKRLEVSGGMEK